MRLFGYWRSSAAYRVRIALALKGLTYEQVGVHLARGEQHLPDFAAVNPQQLVPALQDGEHLLFQSLAIIEYLEETHPLPRLLPTDAAERARVRSLAQIVACEIHPLNNLRVLSYLTGQLAVSEEQKLTWYRHWVTTGFAAFEERLGREPWTGRFCHRDAPGLADIALAPQIANARRFKVDLTPFPVIRRIADECMKLEAFQKAAPEHQPDADRS